MYTLIIKGDETAAFAACREHKVEITSIVKHNKFDECIVTTPYWPNIDTILVQWFCESNAPAPYPAGTLMWYGPRPLKEAQEALVQNMKVQIARVEG
jgi:hypothetical protein